MSFWDPFSPEPSEAGFSLPRARPHPGGSPSARRGQLGLAGLLATALVVSLAASKTGWLLPQSIRPVPSGLAGPFGGAGFKMGLGELIPLFTLMFVSYVVAIRAAGHLSGRAVLMTIAALNALVLLAPPLLSTDIFSYGAYGRMAALHGINPYLHGPRWIWLDPMYQFVGSQWVAVPTAYSPLFTALSAALAPLDIAANVIAYKGIAAVSSLVIVVMVWNTARLRGLDPVKAAALVGLNPVIVVYGVGGGHNDLLMLAVLMTGVYALLQGRARSGGALIVTATAIKLTAGLVLPFALAAGAGQPGTADRRRRVAAGAGIAVAVIAGFGFWLFGTGPLHMLGTLRAVQNHTGLQSIPGFISIGLGLGQLSQGAELVLTAAWGVSVLWLLRRVWIGELDWITGAGWATFALLITAGSLLPWYMAWLIPLAALSPDRRLMVVAVVMTGLGLTSL